MRQDFVEYVKNHIKDYLPEDYHDAKIILEKVTKGNDRILTGLTICKAGEQVTQTFYLEPYDFQHKNSIDFSVSFYNYHEPSIYPCL